MTSGLSPREHYQHDLHTEGFVHDASQAHAVDLLQGLYEELIADTQKKGNVLSKLLGRIHSKSSRRGLRGLYFWGGVGRGKTYLMDLFFESLPFEEKRRLHFHRFMRQVHQELKQYKGMQNPLDIIADQYAAQMRVLCFDEFFVTDIADAMILGNLMTALFERGVTLIATSNIDPDNLYRDGLQRARFLPAIEQIKTHTRVVNLDGGVDYRLRALQRLQLFHTPLNVEVERRMSQCFESLIPEGVQVRLACDLEIENRTIQAVRCVEGSVWFDFYEICDGPRSQNDYIELAKEFHTVLISAVPRFHHKDDLARRFINLVDEFYDRGVKLIISAETGLSELYSEGRLQFEFERTQSRLLEMQSSEYLATPHRP